MNASHHITHNKFLTQSSPHSTASLSSCWYFPVSSIFPRMVSGKTYRKLFILMDTSQGFLQMFPWNKLQWLLGKTKQKHTEQMTTIQMILSHSHCKMSYSKFIVQSLYLYIGLPIPAWGRSIESSGPRTCPTQARDTLRGVGKPWHWGSIWGALYPLGINHGLLENLGTPSFIDSMDWFKGEF